jgi:hypothetical protein
MRVGEAWIKATEHVEVVVHDGEAADRNGELLGQKLEPCFDPRLAVLKALAAEERPANAPGNAVVVPRDVHVYEQSPSHRHRSRLHAKY